MTSLWLALRYLAGRPALNLLTALGVAMGVALLIATSGLSSAVRRSAQENAGGYQLLIAAKGSPVQAVLSTLFFMEAPTGNIPGHLYEELRAKPGLTLTVPFNFGDSYRGHFIVGTTADYLKFLQSMMGRPPITQPPDTWAVEPFQAVIGAAAAVTTGLKRGDQFVASHGFIELPKDLAQHHDAQRYTVVGILERTNTPADRAIFTTLDTAWIVHGQGHGAHEGAGAEKSGEAAAEHEHEDPPITAMLVQGKGYGDVARLSASLARSLEVQAIFPGRIATQILSYVSRGETILTAMAWLATGIATIAVMISLLAAAIERRRQIAMLRAIGGSRGIIFGLLAWEAVIVTGFGALAGLALGRAVASIIAWRVAETNGLMLQLGPVGWTDLAAVAGAVLLGLLAGALPAYSACREDVSRNLAATA